MLTEVTVFSIDKYVFDFDSRFQKAFRLLKVFIS